MPTSQRVERDWDDLTPKEIAEISAWHVGELEKDPNTPLWQMGSMQNIVLYTTGRKTGEERKVALPIWNDADGNPIVVASFQGAEHDPAWFLNIRDRDNPYVTILAQDGLHDVEPQILTGSDYDETWADLTADRAWYQDYQDFAGDRQIPLVRLVEITQAD
jgi:deazaflavin-dependent oxidoreductase (nitroreductase family)